MFARTPMLLIALVLAGCGGPLDRKDGALRIQLLNVPAGVDELDGTVRTAGCGPGDANARTFHARLKRPADDVVSTFSAVPSGAACVTVQLLSRGDPIETRSQPVQIDRGTTVDIAIDFLAGPVVDIEQPPVEAKHRIVDGAILLEVRPKDVELTGEITAQANGSAIDLFSGDGGITRVGLIDPQLAGSVLPAPIRIDVRACLLSDPKVCSIQTRSVEVHRRIWSASLEGAGEGRPAFDPASGAILAGDLGGNLRRFDLDSMTEAREVRRVQIAAPIRRAVAVSAGAGVAAVVGGDEVLHGIRISTFEEAWSADFRGQRPTGAVDAGGNRGFVIGAGRRLFRVDASTGDRTELAALPGEIQGEPLADASGVAAADLFGNVVALDPDGRTLFRASAGAPVIAPLARQGDLLVAGTIDGHVLYFDPAGSLVDRPFNLGRPIAHRPVVAADRLVVAADDLLAWIIRPDAAVPGVYLQRLSDPITGAPAPWLNGRGVVFGLRSGSVVIVDGRAPKVISKLPGVAYAPLVLSPPEAPKIVGRIAVAGSRGDLEMLLVEEGF